MPHLPALIAMSRPCVFISSVFQTLEVVRRTIYRIVTEEFGWQAWWPEPRVASGPLVRQMCFSNINAADLYLGVFPNRYGDDRMGLAFTELEYHHAISLEVPTLIYHLRDTTAVDSGQRLKQEAFLFLVQDKDIGHPRLTEVKNKKELYDRIRRDLRSFGDKWILGVAQTVDPATPIRHLLLPFKLDPNMSCRTSTSPLGEVKFDPDLVRLYFRLMDREYEQSFHGVIEIASVLLDYMLSFPRWKDREYLDLLTSLLRRWHKAGSWAGVAGTLSPLGAAKAQMRARQIAEDYENLYETAGAIASCYYSEGNLDQALKWSKVTGRFQEDFSTSGSVLIACGMIDRAERSYRRALEKCWHFGKEDSYGLNLSHLGLIECQCGNIREGLQKLHEGVALTKRSRGSQVRTLRSLARGLDIAGDRSAAISTLQFAIDYARLYGLMGQLRSAEKEMLSA